MGALETQMDGTQMTQMQMETQTQFGTQLTQAGQTMNNFADMTASDYFTQGQTPSQTGKSQSQYLDDDVADDGRPSSECDLPEEEKTTLAETQFMMCGACGHSPMRIKQSATGFLFASCQSFPRCKAAVHLPKCMKNVMISDQTCEDCKTKDRGQVNKIRFDIHMSALDPTKVEEMEKFLDTVDFQFCLFKGCDSNYIKLRELCKGSKKKPCKIKTFTDCARKNPEELKEYNEYKKRYREERWGQQSKGKGFG